MLLKTSDEIKWNIDIFTERNYWKANLIKKFIIIPKACPLCASNNIHEIENSSLNNPILYKCTKYGKLLYLRKNNIFELFPRTPASLIHNVIKLWLIGEKNATNIYKNLVGNSGIRITDNQTIRNILTKLRLTISHYLRDKYALEYLADENANRKIAIDESLFTHYENKQIWVIGMIDTNTKEFRLVPTFSRDSNTLKDIVLRYIRPGNTLITDAWSGYNWISQPNSGFHHIIHNHGHGQFGYADESTSHIEQLWSRLKGLFKRIYVSITGEHFILFLREIEWRITLSLKNDEEKSKNY